MSKLTTSRSLSFALAALAPGAGGQAAEPVRLVVVDAVRVPALASAALKSELEAVLAPVAGSPAWRRIALGEPYAAEEIPLVLLWRPRATSGRLVLGSAPRDAVRPAAWVFVGAVLDALGLPPSLERLSGPEARRLGTALGRVASHELVHAVAPGGDHAASGLMARHFHTSALGGARPALDPASAARLRAGLDAWRRDGTAGSAVVARGPAAAQTAEAGPR